MTFHHAMLVEDITNDSDWLPDLSDHAEVVIELVRG